MGNQETKLSFRKAVVELTTKTQPIDPSDDGFWDQFWNQPITSVQDVFALIPSAEIRALREELPSNLATLCYKAVEKLVQVAESSCRTPREQQVALNCVRLLTRLLPYVFEEPEWRGFFWSTMPGSGAQQIDADRMADDTRTENPPLAKTLLATVSDLLFCPDFTVAPLPASRRAGGGSAQPDSADDLQSLDSCEYIWEAGVGFVYSPPRNAQHDANRTELLRLLLTCFSETIYSPPPDVSGAAQTGQNRLALRAAVHNPWIAYFASSENRHVLPIFVSLLNVVFAYDPVGYGVPYNYLMFDDSSRERLVETCLQVMCVTLENDLELICGASEQAASSPTGSNSAPQSPGARGSSARSSVSNGSGSTLQAGAVSDNQFVNYLARLHREEDMEFVLRGFIRLLNNPLMQTYLPGSAKRVRWEQELLILFWKMCDANRKFMHFVLKTTDVLSLLQPVLYFVLEARNEPARVGLVHLGVFVLLLVSGERNFGVRLNKPYAHRVSMPDLPVFNGNHADLLVIALHKLITSTQQRLQPLYDCLLTILVNISPYLKSLSMLAATKLLHLFEAFSTGWFLLAAPNNHHLVFFLLEIFNNLIQYQFDGNANLVYMIIRKRQAFHQLANLPTDSAAIARIMQKIRASVPAAGTTGARTAASFASTLAADASKRSVSSAQARPSDDETDATRREEADFERAALSNSSATGTSDGISNTVTTTTTSLAATPSLSSMTAQRVATATASGGPQRRAPQLDDDDERLDLAADGDLANTESEVDADGNDTVKPKVVASPEMDDHSVQNRLSSAFRGVSSPQLGATPTNSRPQSAILQAAPRASGAAQPESTGVKRSTSQVSMQSSGWQPSAAWVASWKGKLPLQTIMRLLQVLVPQVEKMCIERGLTDETEILKFLQHGTLVGLLPVPHPILIRKYQPNAGTAVWFRTYMWGVIYLRNVDPPIWFDTDVKLFDIQRV